MNVKMMNRREGVLFTTTWLAPVVVLSCVAYFRSSRERQFSVYANKSPHAFDAAVRYCSPLTRDELLYTGPSAPCIRNAKIHACNALQSRGAIPKHFDCTTAPRFNSAVAVAFQQQWQRLVSAETMGVFHDSCLRSNNDASCTRCRSWFHQNVAVDVRLSEHEALSIIDGCAELPLNTLYGYFANASINYFEYRTLTPSEVLKSAPNGWQTLFQGPTCAPQRYCEPLLVAINRLKALTPTDCSSLADKTVVIGTSWQQGGLGSIVHIASNDLLIASAYNASFIRWRSEPFYWVSKDCEALDFTCYYTYPGKICGKEIDFESYKQPSKSDLKRMGFDLTNTYRREGATGILRRLKDDAQAPASDIFSAFVRHCVRSARCDSSECEQAKKDLSQSAATIQFARTASVAVFQSHLNEQVSLNIQEAKRTMNMPHPIISIHVRRGDKHLEMELLELSAYLVKALPIMMGFGVKSSFLSTEDPEVINTAKTDFDAIHWKFTKDKRTNPAFGDFLSSNLTEEFYLGMRNLYLATECDFFVGARQSNWCRLIDELQRANGIGGTYYVDAHGHLEASAKYTS